MAKQRAEIGFSSNLDEMDLSDWKSKPEARTAKKIVPREDIHKVAKASGFDSREAAVAVEEPPKPGRTGRIYRTGRSEQLNLKVRGEDKSGFYDICDREHWVQGYTFQRAIEALNRELQAEKKKQ